MKKKKNRFLLFCFSFLPGAGEMYFGLMKTGISLLSIFAVSVMLASYTQVGVLMFVPLVVWVYSFFHANNMGALSDEEFGRLEDEYLFRFGEKEFGFKAFVAEKYRKAFAIVLIVLGMTMLWQTFCRVLRHIVGNDFYYEYISRFTTVISDDIPRVIVAFVIIWFGVKLIRGKKEELDRLENDGEPAGFTGNTGSAFGSAGASGQKMSGAAGSVGNPEQTMIPVERIEQVEVVDTAADNSRNLH